MALAPGSRIGAYQVVALIGRGGMGEVYRARDTRLGRDVALKTLPEDVVSDRDFLLRFEREARVLASLTHPNIAVIHGIEERPSIESVHPGGSALVMEFIEGDTLADRVRRGPLPLDDALAIAAQIADALDAAHQKGIVHRDLKPANVKITPEGVVKVLDFGLAKTLAPAAPDGVTISVTGPAVVLGTPAYMAPEQAHGRSADTRVDVWAFGVVVYEMLVGERPFRGESTPDTLTAVLTTEPQWERVPPAVRPLLRACLERDPRKRLRDIADYKFLIASSGAPAAERRLSAGWWALLGATATAAAVLGYAAGRASPSNALPPAPSVQLSTMLPAGASVIRGPGYTSSVAVSPDGETLVIAGSDKDGQRLYRRTLGRLEATPIPGTERGSSPFFSWNGEWLGFFADGHLKRIAAAGGAPVDIAEAPGFPAGASWGPDDTIVFAYGADPSLHAVSARGGRVERLAGVSQGRHPEVLADGKTVLYESAGRIHVLDRHAGKTKELLPGRVPRYAAGHVILTRGTTLLAAPFDPATNGPAGTAFPIAEGVATELPGSAGGGHYSVSRQGTLAYVPAANAYSLVVLGADGVEREITDPQLLFENPRFSPRDGRTVVVASRQRADEPADLWMHDLRSRTATRLTFNGGRAPVWTPDGTGVTYSHLGQEPGIYTRRVDGGGAPRRLLSLTAFHWLVGWSPDAATLAFGAMDKETSSIKAFRDGDPRIVVGPASTWGGRLSSDGHWLAYYLLERGAFNVYVQRFPESDTRWEIAQGTDPAWAPDGNEIYYRSGPRLMAARIDKASGVRVLSRRVVVDPFLPPLYDDYDVHPDGRTIVLVRPANRTQGREVIMVLNWIREFEQKE